MNDDMEIEDGAAENDGIVFNQLPPNRPEAPEPPAQRGVALSARPAPEAPERERVEIPSPDASAYTLSDEVGLKINPSTRPHRSADDLSKLLRDVRLPERRETADEQKDAIPLIPTAAPLGAITSSMPQYIRSGRTPATPERRPSPPANIKPAVLLHQDGAPLGEPERESASPVVSLHTMKGDVEEAVRRDNISTLRAVALEAQKRAKTAPPPSPRAAATSPPRRRRGAFLVVTTVVFLLLGCAALYATYFVATQKTPAPVPSTAIMFAEKQTVLALDGRRSDALKQTLAQIAATVGSGSGSIVQVVPVTTATSTGQIRPATLGEFLLAIGARPPDQLLRALSSDFFFGIHSTTDVPSPVLIVPVESYDNAFAGMLAWESTIDSQLSPPFSTVPAYLPSDSTSTPPVLRTFQDAVMQNYDVRTLKDDSGSIVLYYSFPNQRLLVIAGSPLSFPEILSRLEAQRRL